MPLRHALLAVAVAATWGLNFVVIEVGLEDVPALLLCALRFALVAVPLAFFVPRPPIPWRLLAGIGVALGVVKFGLLFTAMDVGMPAGLASVVLQAQAPFTVLLAAALLRERPSGGRLAGLVTALAGIALIAAGRGGGVTPAGPGGGGRGWAPGGAGPARRGGAGGGGGRGAGWVWGGPAGGAGGAPTLGGRGAGAAEPLGLMVWFSLTPPLPLMGLALVIDGPHAV